jgi:hypothetical protein
MTFMKLHTYAVICVQYVGKADMVPDETHNKMSTTTGSHTVTQEAVLEKT